MFTPQIQDNHRFRNDTNCEQKATKVTKVKILRLCFLGWLLFKTFLDPQFVFVLNLWGGKLRRKQILPL